MQLNIQLPPGKFSYAIKDHVRIESIERLQKTIEPEKVKKARKQVWITKKQRNYLTTKILEMTAEGKNRKEIKNAIFGTSLVTDEQGNTMTSDGTKTAIYRILKKHGLTYGRRGRPSMEK